MEECCVVCAEPLEWVAYGPCGHKDVCSTCIARLRFVLDDKKCCICKQECPFVFVTRALGDYTKVISDFEVFSDQGYADKEGTEFWYDNNIEAYFDDVDHFKMIKAMCRLYCSICEQTDPPVGRDFVRKGYIFRNLEHLRRHFYHVHGVQMCGLCLEGRKVFIGEQKLYTKAQLDRHLSRGDSEIDGKEGERGAFAGHPMCDFCRTRFYGDNELFQHMSRDHFTCHICERLRPGRFDYYRNYDDLEAHFRHEHHLCEDKECLAKKFMVFPSDTELKRHNALEHGGNMSRAQRNAVLQIPVSFQYQRPRQDYGLPRGASRNRGAFSDAGFPEVMHASTDTAVLEARIQEVGALSAEAGNTTSNDSAGSRMEPDGPTSALPHDESERLTSTEPSRYLTAVSGSVPSTLQNSAFPPLPGLSSDTALKGKQQAQGANSMAARLGAGQAGRRTLTSQVHRSSRANNSWSHPLEAMPVQRNRSNTLGLTESSTANRKHLLPAGSGSQSQPSSSQPNLKTNISWSQALEVPAIPGSQSQPSSSQRSLKTNNSLSHALEAIPTQLNKLNVLNSSGSSAANRTDSLSRNSSIQSQPSASHGNSGASTVVNPVISFMENGNDLSSNQLNMDEIRIANKVLVEHIRAGLNGDEELFTAFKDISSQFRKGEIDAKEYCKYIFSFGLSHLVCELARLCPDPTKQKDLLDAYHQDQNRYQLEAQNEMPLTRDTSAREIGDIGRRGMNKNKVEISAEPSTAGMKQNQDRGKSMADEVEVLSKDGYRDVKGKMKMSMSNGANSASEVVSGEKKFFQVLVKARDPLILNSSSNENTLAASSEDVWSCVTCTLENKVGLNECLACGADRPSEKTINMEETGGGERRKKKTPKFQRIRLGDGSLSALLEPRENPWNIVHREETTNAVPSGGKSFGRGVWKNGGVQRIVGKNLKDA